MATDTVTRTLDITREVAIKVRDTVAAGLVGGLGEPIPGRMCIEAAICYALGLAHGDDPGCVSAPLRRLKIRLNDARWSGVPARTAGLRRLALASLGSQDVLDDHAFSRRVVEMTIRRSVPAAPRPARESTSSIPCQATSPGQPCRSSPASSPATAP